MRKIIGLAIFLIPLVAFPREVTLHFPQEGKYILFLPPDQGNVYPLEGKDVVIDVPEGNFPLAVCDEHNRGAEKKLKAEDSSLSFSESDFSLIYKVAIQLTDSRGVPIDYAVVTLSDSQGNKHTYTLREEDEGVCFFYFLPQGKASLEARRGDLRISQDFELSQKPEPSLFKLSFASLALPHKEKPAPEKTSEKKEEKPAPKREGNPFLSAFLSLLIILIIIYIVFLFLRRRGVDITAMIKQQRGQTPAGQPVPSSPISSSPDICPYCGQRKDPVTGACACTPTAVPSSQTAPVPSGQARLRGLEGALAGEVFPLEKEVTLGRGEDRDIVVPDNAVSRKHCKIVLEEDGYYIVDEGSTNGTFVGGIRIAREKLKNGDIIQIGESKFRFEL